MLHLIVSHDRFLKILTTSMLWLWPYVFSFLLIEFLIGRRSKLMSYKSHDTPSSVLSLRTDLVTHPQVSCHPGQISWCICLFSWQFSDISYDIFYDAFHLSWHAFQIWYDVSLFCMI